MEDIRPEGQLELTWTNKHRRLLAHDDSSYEWVDPSDYRVAEVRLLHDVTADGEPPTGPDHSRASDNLLIRGDALSALTSLIDLPEFASEYAGRVRLVYIDPPFNTGQIFKDYDDGLEHSVWLTMIRDRLEQVQNLLAPNGSVWLHLDDSEVHRARCVMDEVFGIDKFVATVIWQKRYSRDNRPAIGAVHDYLLVYSPLGGDWKHHRNRMLRLDAKQYRNPNDDPRGRWRPIPMTAQGFRANQMYEIVSPAGVTHLPPKGRCWSMVRETFDALQAEGRIYFGKDGRGQPNVIRYLDEDEGLVPWTWWPADEVGHTDESKKEILELFPDIEAFDTPKPERLMNRIMHIATNPGDVVLDCFLGSGTTAAVAHKMGRRWVGVEWEPTTIANYAHPRLSRVVAGLDPGGITDSVGWSGGGAFRVLDVAPSMFVEEAGRVYLADWAVANSLAEATAAQLGYEYQSEPPFCGRKGRVRLAVVDGLVNADVARLLVGALDSDERLVVCGTSIDPAARSVLREERPGSTLRKIPSSLLADYRLSRQSELRQLMDWESAMTLMDGDREEGSVS